MKQIVIDISAAGTVKVDAQGFKGKGCASATEQIEIALGGNAPKKKSMKPEAFSSPSTGVTNNRTF